MENNQSNKPIFDVLYVAGEGEKSHWQRLGAAWECKGNGYNISLNCIPVNWDGRLVLLPPKPKKGKPANEV